VKGNAGPEIELQLLSPQELCKLLKCSRPYVYKLAASGALPCVRVPSCEPGSGKRKKDFVRFKKTDVWAFIQTHYRNG